MESCTYLQLLFPVSTCSITGAKSLWNKPNPFDTDGGAYTKRESVFTLLCMFMIELLIIREHNANNIAKDRNNGRTNQM